MPFAIHGDMTDLSEVGARVTTPALLERDRPITVDVRNGYSFLFRAQAKIVWATEVEFLEDARLCVHGMLFTALSPFSRKLIQRLGKTIPSGLETSGPSIAGGTTWYGVETDSDLEAFFPFFERADDGFDLLSDPVLEKLLPGEVAGAREVDHGNGSAQTGAELSGQFGYFNNTDVLQMLEGARATGVLYLEGECEGEIHVIRGRICGCFSGGRDEYQALLRLIVADRGRFRFVPKRARTNLLAARSTTELLLEAQLRLDLES
jgi:hypothetical protein